MISVISEAGVDVLVAGGKFGDMALRYVNKYNMMAVRLMSKWDVRRLDDIERAVDDGVNVFKGKEYLTDGTYTNKEYIII